MELEGIEPIRLVVMENVFCTDLKIHEKYDLKVRIAVLYTPIRIYINDIMARDRGFIVKSAKSMILTDLFWEWISI